MGIEAATENCKTRAMAYSYLGTKIALLLEGRWIQEEEASGGETLSGAVCDPVVKTAMTWTQSQWDGEERTPHEVLKWGILWTKWHCGWALGRGAGREPHFCKGRPIWQADSVPRASYSNPATH